MNKAQSGSTARRRRLNELLRVIGIETEDTTELTALSDRAQEIGRGGLFVALRGDRADGGNGLTRCARAGGTCSAISRGNGRSCIPIRVQSIRCCCRHITIIRR